MQKMLARFGWPVLSGLLVALVLQQIFPSLTGSRQGWLAALSGPVRRASPPESYYSAVSMASPAVVHIFSSSMAVDQPSPNPSVSHYFQGRQKSLGSGVIVNKAGYILTNNHVINGANNLIISLKDGRQAIAEIVGTDLETDLAVLKVGMDNLPVASWADSSRNVHVGDVVLAIGNPFGLGQTVSAGIISATQRNLRLSTYESFLQTDAAINVGNSGGALVNTRGKLVGIATALITSDGGSEGLGFAIPSNMARFVLQSIITHGRVIRGWLGIEAQTLTPELSEAYGIPVNTGIVVSGVYPASPAFKAGIKRGDVILNINRSSASDGQSVMAYVATLIPGNKVTLRILVNNSGRKLAIKKVNMIVDERPEVNPFR